jgi:glutathione synthase
MKTLYVMDPLDRIDVGGDSTFTMMRECRRRGWPVYACTPSDLYAIDSRCWARSRAVTVQDSSPHLVAEDPVDVDVGTFDVVWMRKDPPFDIDYIFSTYLLDLVPPQTLVLNRPASLRDANEKMVGLRWPELGPPTFVTREIRRAVQWVADAPGKVVLKPWDGNGGRGIVVTAAGDPNLRAMLETLTDQERRYIVMQHYIPEIAAGDKRVILIDGEALGWFNRIPSADDHRGNMHVGARVEACELTDRDRHICEMLSPWMKKSGLVFVGIDIIGPYLTEINVTSPTGIQEVHALMGVALEEALVDAVGEALARHRQGVL